MKFDILSPSLELFQERFLEASAGTGKTFAIEHLYVRLLIEGENPLTVEQILVVTFTRAATRELKMRVLANIERALSSLNRGEAAFPYLEKLLNDNPKRALSRLRTALALADRMQIFTIHRFCHQMLTESAFEAISALELADPEESSPQRQLQQLVEDFFRTGLDPRKYSAQQIHLLLGRYPGGFGRLTRETVKLLKERVEIAPLPTFADVAEKISKLVKEFPEVSQELFLQDYQSVSQCYKKMTSSEDECAQQAALLGEILEKKECSEEVLDRLIAYKKLFLEQMEKNHLKKRYTPPTTHYPGLFERLREELLPLLQAAGDPLLLLLRLTRDCKLRLEEKRGLVSFDELLERMAKSLENPLFLEKVQGRYQAAIIDEFQDTDPLQWEIFEKLFVGKARAFYLVGDPKQSIYLFRNADIKTYEKAKDLLGSKGRAFLTTNFRSQPSLVHALNALLRYRPGLLGPLEILPVEAGREEAASSFTDRKGAVHFFIAQGKVGNQRWPSREIEEEYFFPFIAQEIQRHRLYGSCAVLVRDRYQAERIDQFLKRWQIPSLVMRGRSLLESAAFTALRDLIELLFDPRNPRLLRRALAGPLFAWTEEELNKEEMEAELHKIHKWHLLCKEKGLAVALGTFIAETPLDPDWGDAFVQLACHLLASDDDPLFFLDEIARCADEEEEGLKLRQTEEEGKVLIMTMHVSKGLEFEVVFALGLASRHTPKKGRFEKVEGRLVKFDPNDPACQELAQSQEAEKMRQLYVALTRAKQRVYFPIALPEDGKLGNSPSELFAAHLGEDLFASLEVLSSDSSISYERLEKNDFILTKEALPLHEKPPSPLHFTLPGAPRMLTSFSSLAEKKPHSGVQTDEEGLPAGAATGNLLHAVLEKALLSPDKIEEIVAKEVRGSAFAGWKEEVARMVRSALEVPIEIAGKRIQLSTLPASSLFPEVEFLFPYQGDRMKGFIDLVLLHEEVYYFLDWKSNLLANYDQESLKRAMSENDYFLQASIYAEALKRYFSLLPYRFGGAVYLFLRGPAAYSFTPEALC